MHIHFETSSRWSFTFTSPSHNIAGSITQPGAHPLDRLDPEWSSVVDDCLHLKVSTCCRHTGSLTEKTSLVSSTPNPSRRHTLKKRFDRLLKRSDRNAFAYPQEEYPREEYPQEADSQPHIAELSASRSSQELSTFASTRHELMGSQAFGSDAYATDPTMSQASRSTSPSDNLSLNTAQRSNYTPETMSFGRSYDSPISPGTPHSEGPGHRQRSGFPDESAKALLFENMDRHPSFAASHSSFEVSPTKSMCDRKYSPQTEGLGALHQDNPNISAAYPMYATQPNFSPHQAPWSIGIGTQLITLQGIVDPGWNNPPNPYTWTGYHQMQTAPPVGFSPIAAPGQFDQQINFNGYQHPQDALQLPQGGFEVVENAPNPSVPCGICTTNFTGKYARGNRKRHHLLYHNTGVVAAEPVCRDCGKPYKRADAARKHEWEKHKILDTKPKTRKDRGSPSGCDRL
ncbi:hypothetical protein P3342_003470 [Pyrenophora teres f. teres]|uniref:Uncharacterized protein n=1 Tax=Pyrenophora teres f. teres TaxID=97479 RepID=A0A6S6VJN6_9PLEO|nr:hypothetical protein P3342_003470 [Pyrenophora teres f. teres]CAE7011682.1 hypothetical protein PTTW11_02231 [Pyrenophora teres f. teres]